MVLSLAELDQIKGDLVMNIKGNPAPKRQRQFTDYRNDRGQGLTEYLILLLLIAVISIAATQSLGKTIKSKLQSARKQINEVSGY